MKDREIRELSDEMVRKACAGEVDAKLANMTISKHRAEMSRISTGMRSASSRGKVFKDDFFEEEDFISKPRRSRK